MLVFYSDFSFCKIGNWVRCIPPGGRWGAGGGGSRSPQSVGFREPDDASIQEAIEANDQFISQLQAIHQRAQALTIDQDD